MPPEHLAASHPETDVILACLSALGELTLSDPAALAAFDEIAAGGEPFWYPDMARQHESERLARILGLSVGGFLMHWHDGGAAQAGILYEHICHAPPADPGVEFQILTHLLDLASTLADSRAAGGSEPAGGQLLAMSESAERLARLLGGHGRVRAAAQIAPVAVRLRRWASAPQDQTLMRFALRMMSRAEKRVFLALTPRAKYPAPRATGVPDDVLPELVFGAIRHLFLDFLRAPQPGAAIASIDDFNRVAREMLEDRDHVVFMEVQLEYQYPGQPVTDCPIKRVEVRFSQSLLRRVDALLAAAGPTDATMYHWLFDLVVQLLLHREDMERWRDEYLFDWFALRGARPYRENAFFEDGVIFVMSAPPMAKVVIGESEADIEPWDRYEFFSDRSREFLRLAKSRLT